MKSIAEEKTMTTKELAETLGVDVRTVNGTVERLLESTFQKVCCGWKRK
jgi:Mn-dependent DtxR family transcriptional regulator